ncbi:hypothetical protein OQH61_02290 [Helicobacter sp. MIT 21-1697]|uniref:hypothetical protein n=1 Tax=Helicobacter sp. MIT 21-1697 TaxID=2993733 RepID=UPI00224B771E|nr:hypothetical protein [Helicobacter sp. MIT 21-1697]MCX2716559.1 hypothetical protein [Helicobacter sp. MIT 21-1697]
MTHIFHIICYFHCVILAYLVFIFVIGCGYKADPFYKEPTKQEQKMQSQNPQIHNKKVLFYGIDSTPPPSEEQDW